MDCSFRVVYSGGTVGESHPVPLFQIQRCSQYGLRLVTSSIRDLGRIAGEKTVIHVLSNE